MPNRRPQPDAEPLIPRGVYEHPFVGPQGERYLVAVDHRGCRLMEATLYPGITDPAAVTSILRELLDRMDPTYLRVLP